MLFAIGGVAVGAVMLTAADRDARHEHGEVVSAVTTGSGITGHETHAAAAAPSPTTEANQPAAQPTAAEHEHTGTPTADAMSEENAHFHHEEVRVTEADLRAGLALVDEVRTATAPYADIRQALADGYVQVTQDLPGIAAHFARVDFFRDGREIDAAYPEVLLYSKRLDGTWRFLGVMFQSEGATAEPPDYFGGLDSWHYHTNLCFTFARGGATVRVVAAEAECVAPSVYNARTPWELHVWTEPGAEGPFAHDYAPISPGAFPPATLPAAAELGTGQALSAR
jgi:hypothetical protein